MSPYLRAGVGIVGLALVLAGGGYALATTGSAAGDDPDPAAPLGPGPVTVELGIHHSRFDTDEIVVEAGTEVRFVLQNDDPILHELIVGPPDVHERHENGTEAAHPPRPGEVTVGPLTSAATTYAFDEPGSFEFACHLPGHRAYGMTGQVVVVDRAASGS